MMQPVYFTRSFVQPWLVTVTDIYYRRMKNRLKFMLMMVLSLNCSLGKMTLLVRTNLMLAFFKLRESLEDHQINKIREPHQNLTRFYKANFSLTCYIHLFQQVIQLTGFSDPVYAETYVNVNQYDIVLDVLIVNQTPDTLQGLTLELATLGMKVHVAIVCVVH